MCRVDGCGRRAAVSVVRDDLPGPIRLCATHTEDFRMNGARWSFTWDSVAGVPASVRAAPLPPVGRGPSPTGDTPATAGASHRNVARRLLSTWRRPR